MKKITLLLLMLLLSISGYSQLALEGFESTTGPDALPSTNWTLGTGNWAVFDNGVGIGQRWGINSALPYQGTNSAYMNRENIGQGNTSEDYLATPLVTIPTNGQLRFFTRSFTAGNQGTIYQIRIAPSTASQTNPAAYTLVQQWTEDELTTDFNIYEEKIVNLAAYAGQQVYVSFMMSFTQPTTALGGDRWLVDNVRIVQRCLDPTTLTATGITLTSANLSWANPSGATSWEIEIIPAGDTPTGTGVVYNGALPYVATQTSTGVAFTSSTPYKYYVRALCSNGASSLWIGPFNFTTASPGISCTAPIVINSLPYSTSNNTANFTDNPSIEGSPGATGCGSTNAYLNGNDVVYAYTATTTGTINVTMTPTGTRSGIFAYSSCANIGVSCLNGVANTASTVRTFDMPVTAGQTYYFVISTWATPQTVAYSLTIQAISCAPPTTLTASNITQNSAQLSWAVTGGATSWEVAVQTAGSPIPSGSGAQTNTNINYIASGLLSGTQYQYYVRADCNDGTFSAWTGPFLFTTSPDYCAGNQFYDNGGPTANYANNSDTTVTICPNNPGEMVTVTFVSFDTETNYDGLYVFDGNSIAAPQIASANPAGNVPGGLAGSYWGTAIPGPFESSSPDGCLTFRFRSDGSVNRAGWVANVVCAPQPTCPKPTALTTTNITSNSVTLGWTNVGPATTWQVIAIPCGSPAPDANTTGWTAATTNPFVLTGLTPATCYNFYVRGECSSSDISNWAGPKSFTTLVAPPVCGGNYVDSGGLTANYANNADETVTICPTNPGDIVTVTFTSFNTQATFDGIYVFDGNSISAPLIPSTNGPGAGTGPLTQPGAYWGTTIPGPFISSSTDGCLTFRFRSNATTTAAGWLANITCSPAPSCPRPTQLTATNVSQTSALLGWTEVGSATQWEILILPLGSPAPQPSATGILAGANPFLMTGLNPGTKYTFYVRALCSSSDISSWSNGVNFNTLLVNDECSGAIFAPVNAGQACTQITPGTLTGATASTAPFNAPCVGTPDDDVWFQFIATNPYLNVSLLNVVGSTTNLNFAVYSGQCGTLTQFHCSATGSLNTVVNNLVVGQTYFIRVYSNVATPQTVDFNLCISTPSTCANSSTVCNITYNNTVGVANQGTIGCLNTTPNPTYFTIQVSTSGPINYTITQTNLAGNPIDVDYVAWGPFTSQNAGCSVVPANPLTGQTTGCSYSAAATEFFNIANAQAGQFYIILITNFANQAGTISLTQTNANSPGAGQTICCPNANFSYSPSTFCKNGGANPIATIAQNSVAGTFSASPAGIVFVNTSTGEIDLAASAPGNYIITNTVMPAGDCTQTKTYTYTISITEPANATIAYGAASYCKSVSSSQPVIFTGTSGGTYSSTPAGLFVNSTTGAITPSTSVPGIYTVNYTKAASGGCPSFVTTATVEIIANPTITQPSNVTACNGYTLPTLTVGNYYDAPGGTGNMLNVGTVITVSQTIYVYASNNGCTNEKLFTVTITTIPAPTLNVTQPTCTVQTGTIEVTAPAGYEYNIDGGIYQTNTTFNNVAPGTHTFTVKDNASGCISDPTIVTINVVPQIPAETSFSYNTPVCQNDTTNPGPILLSGFTNGGTFTSTAGLDIDTSTGVINLNNSTPGNYIVTYTVNYNPTNCQMAGSSTAEIVINPIVTPVTSFSYNTPVCSNGTNPIPVTVTGFTPGGIYSSTVGLSINASTGVINLSNSTPGTYTVTYSVTEEPNSCRIAGSETASITINPTVIPNTTFNYVTPVCFGNTNVMPILSSNFVSGGVFSSTAGLLVNPSTGEINVNASTSGSYTVTYSVQANPSICQLSGFSTAVIVITNPIEMAVSGDCQGSNYVLTASPIADSYDPNNVTYEWTDGSGNTIGGNQQNVTVNTTGNYFVTVVSNGCSGSTTFNVDAIACTIQKGISPNGDGKNDFFDLRGLNVSSLGIYNRYGLKVYSKMNYSDEWYGQADNGNELPDGTYYYVIERSNGQSNTGWIYINRETK